MLTRECGPSDEIVLHRMVAARHSRQILLKMLSFGVIGLGNTVIDLGVFTFVYNVLELPLVTSNVVRLAGCGVGLLYGGPSWAAS